MACARCDFYTPRSSSKGHLLEAKENLQRMLANLPLTEDEQAAVDDGQAALDALLDRLADVPSPNGATPWEIGIPATATLLSIIAVNQGNQTECPFQGKVAEDEVTDQRSVNEVWTTGSVVVRA